MPGCLIKKNVELQQVCLLLFSWVDKWQWLAQAQIAGGAAAKRRRSRLYMCRASSLTTVTCRHVVEATGWIHPCPWWLNCLIGDGSWCDVHACWVSGGEDRRDKQGEEAAQTFFLLSRSTRVVASTVPAVGLSLPASGTEVRQSQPGSQALVVLGKPSWDERPGWHGEHPYFIFCNVM
jgi:hypothetical protein